MKNQEIADVLKEAFGIYKESFTGLGMSVPWDQTYSKSLSREYLVPNVHETDKDVCTWILDPAFMNYRKKVSDLIVRTPPTTESNTLNLGDHIGTIENRMRDPSSVTRLIRFQKFRLKDYSEKVGRTEANKIFFSSLQDVWDMTIEQAAEASGYRVADASSDKEDTSTLSTLKWGVMDEPWWSRSRRADAGIAGSTSRTRNAEIGRQGRLEPPIPGLTRY